MADLFKKKAEFIPDSLIADNDFPIMANGIKVAGGQGILKRGTLVGLSNGKAYVTGSSVDSTSIGVFGVLTDDIEETTEDTISTAYVTGVFNKGAIILDSSAKLDDYKEELRKLGIYLKEIQEN